jgi:FkbM family methyltransferase
MDPWPAAGGRIPSDEELAEACQDLAYLRPLVPYPGYKFDSDWNNRDLAFRMRRKVWTYCFEQGRHPAAEFSWHMGLRLRLNLANDLSKQLFVAGCYDPNEFAFLDKVLEPGMTFIDAGANEGLYALFAARRAGHSGRVLAFEPSAREFSRLKANIARNGLENVTLFPLALADREGEAGLLIANAEHAGQNTLGAFAHEGAGEERREKVPVRSLDNVLASERVGRVDVVKIDVEGAEVRLLEGAKETLRQYRPLLLIEINSDSLAKQGHSRTEITALLESLDYLAYAFAETTGLAAPCGGNTPEGNVLFVPKQRDLPKRIFESGPYYTRRPLIP